MPAQAINALPAGLPPDAAGDGNAFLHTVARARLPMTVSDPTLPDSPIVFATASMCRLTGYEPSEIIGRNPRFLQGPDTDRATVALIRAALEQRVDCTVELLNYRKDGAAFWNALSISPVFAPDGQLRYFFACQLDHSERRAAERQRSEERRLEGLASLAAGVAHEFNNLLTVIRGNLEPLTSAAPATRGASDGRNAARLQRAREAADRAADLTRSITSFARQQLHEAIRLDLHQLIAELSPAFSALLAPRHRLEWSFGASTSPVEADPTYLSAALRHVLLNARDAMQEGGVIRLSVELRRDAAGRPAEVAVAMTDTGCGMSPEIALRALDPFFTTKPPGAGIGMGLAMASGFMRQTGGRLELQSREGEGTTVSLIFPVLPRFDAPRASAAAPGQAS